MYVQVFGEFQNDIQPLVARTRLPLAGQEPQICVSRSLGFISLPKLHSNFTLPYLSFINISFNHNTQAFSVLQFAFFAFVALFVSTVPSNWKIELDDTFNQLSHKCCGKQPI